MLQQKGKKYRQTAPSARSPKRIKEYSREDSPKLLTGEGPYLGGGKDRGSTKKKRYPSIRTTFETVPQYETPRMTSPAKGDADAEIDKGPG